MECCHIKELNIEHTICHLIRYIYMYLMILSSQQMTKVIAFLSNPLSLVPYEDFINSFAAFANKETLDKQVLNYVTT